MTDALSELLGVHESSIEVSYDPESNEISYTISSETYDSSESIQTTLTGENVLDELNTIIDTNSETDESIVDLATVETDDHILGQVNIEVRSDPETADDDASEFTNIYEDEYIVQTSGNYYKLLLIYLNIFDVWILFLSSIRVCCADGCSK